MHTYQSEGGTVFQYNSDFSGDLRVITPNNAVVKVGPAQDIIEFAIETYLRKAFEECGDIFLESLLPVKTKPIEVETEGYCGWTLSHGDRDINDVFYATSCNNTTRITTTRPTNCPFCRKPIIYFHNQ